MNLKLLPVSMLALALCAFAPACGGSDDDDGDPQTADAGTGTGCGNVTEDGVCQGDVAKYCNTVRNVINSYDCRAQESKTCGIVSGIATCVADGTDAGTSTDAGTVTDAGTETDAGLVDCSKFTDTCDGNMLTRCKEGAVSTIDCMPFPCEYSEKHKKYECNYDACEEECGQIGESGTCDGNALKYCSPYSGCLMTEDCGSKKCEYVSDRKQYECVKK